MGDGTIRVWVSVAKIFGILLLVIVLVRSLADPYVSVAKIFGILLLVLCFFAYHKVAVVSVAKIFGILLLDDYSLSFTVEARGFSS